MLTNFHKFNERAPPVKPENYLTIEELKEFNIEPSPNYVPPPVKKETDDYIGLSTS